MTKEYPDYERYRALYRRYYDGRDVAELLRLLEPLQDTRVIDLCGGEGRLTLAALAQGAREVALVDAEAAMIPPPLRQHEQVKVRVLPVHDALLAMRIRGESFDRVVCRQAVNYWLNEATAGLTARVLKSGGIFAFNTFNQMPTEKPRVMKYERDGHYFVEVSQLVGNMVHHLQARDGMEPHRTSFEWLPPVKLRSMLEPHFSVVEYVQGKTSLYRCEKK